MHFTGVAGAAVGLGLKFFRAFAEQRITPASAQRVTRRAVLLASSLVKSDREIAQGFGNRSAEAAVACLEVQAEQRTPLVAVAEQADAADRGLRSLPHGTVWCYAFAVNQMGRNDPFLP